MLRLENPTFTVERTKADVTLKERVKTRALELKTLEAKEEEAAKSNERERRKADPSPARAAPRKLSDSCLP